MIAPRAECEYCHGVGTVPALLQNVIDGPQRHGFMACWCTRPPEPLLFPPDPHSFATDTRGPLARRRDFVNDRRRSG